MSSRAGTPRRRWTIEPSRLVSTTARTMVDRDVNRLHVVDRDGTLVGIVTRAGLVRAFARHDEACTVAVDVEHGEVTVSGFVESRGVGEALPQLVAAVPGFVGVRTRVARPDA